MAGKGLLPLGVGVLAVFGGISYFFAPTDPDTGAAGASPPPLQRYRSPEAAVVDLYKSLSDDKPIVVCGLTFSDQGAQQFATLLGAKDCTEAVHKVSSEVTDSTSYRSVVVPSQAVQETDTHAVIRSCDLKIEGGPLLGTFVLDKISGGWAITGYDNATCTSNSATSNPTQPT